MKIFIVLKKGVYWQGVCGLRDEFEPARALADKCARNDKDSYHNYDVHEMTLNGAELERYKKPLYSIHKDKIK